ncbi:MULTISPECIES: hypothetical protein [Actinomadura]|uniref:Uncharacterized protein n=1 Tax=Actinomadura yumaensis TaxID=111807 RepID=A0ABW2CRL3_9ACTN|nr:hypothetical protein [Actinomadura sp. J1-007]MWK39755.1 hypothetical protein [Actinomadura sp. J1-007]
MGIDWIRMRPRPAVPRAVLEALVHDQAARYAGGGRLPGDLHHLTAPPPPTAHDAPGADGASGADGRDPLWDHVEIDPGPDSARRVNTVGLSPVLPAEWRLAAYRTHLPDELPGRLRRWTEHLAAVRDGRHRPYLRAWYAHSTARTLAHEWEPLRQRALTARGSADEWAARPELVEIRDRVLTEPPPPTPPAPSWPATPAHRPETAGTPYGADGSYGAEGAAARTVDAAPYARLAREWNRRVPHGQKVRVTLPPDFEEFLAAAVDDPWLDDCLRWLRAAVRDGHGLLLR